MSDWFQLNNRRLSSIAAQLVLIRYGDVGISSLPAPVIYAPHPSSATFSTHAAWFGITYYHGGPQG